jgi:hypothetical protein
MSEQNLNLSDIVKNETALRAFCIMKAVEVRPINLERKFSESVIEVANKYFKWITNQETIQ